ncbi:mycothiol synthase [Umezawaea tangerina]|uniref:Mycothiol acetyltransferase n=1 Tax=Umezawaea tangerina TaxID=84725 RepID=A0A2T0TCA2_9PSEU|nr:mycothiol synthase [Umezawaea tangerina]PRY43274.1 mycothiol synthase [Umezawaea tangerina]
MAESSWHNELSEAQADEVGAVLAAAERVDGVAPVGEHVRLRMRPGARGSAHLLARVDGVVVGYAHLDLLGDSAGNQVAELVVHPEHRKQGVGTEVGTAVVAKSAPLRVWAHGNHPGAAALAGKLGFRNVRELRRMRRSLDGELPSAPLPEGVRLRAFVPGQDEAGVVFVNHRAFSWHPEQGAMSIEDVHHKEAEDWFDPKGFLLAVDDQGTLLGFHWTKVHEQAEPLGEVYVVGVDPDAQGGGLGKALTVAGLRYLQEQGLREVMLYVESDNAAAVRVYTRLGFTLWDSDVQYGR